MKTYMLMLLAFGLAACGGSRGDFVSPQLDCSASISPSNSVSVKAGDSIKLSYTLHNCTSASLSQNTAGAYNPAQQINPVGGQLVLTPTQNTVYTLSAFGASGAASQQLTVNILQHGSVSFSVHAASVLLNRKDTLVYQARNTTSCAPFMTPSTNIIDAVLAKQAKTVDMSLADIGSGRLEWTAGSTFTPNTHKVVVGVSCQGDDGQEVRDSVAISEVQPSWTVLDSVPHFKFGGDTVRFFGHELACTTPNGVDFRGTLTDVDNISSPNMMSSGCLNANTAFNIGILVPFNSAQADTGRVVTAKLQSNGPLLTVQTKVVP